MEKYQELMNQLKKLVISSTEDTIAVEEINKLIVAEEEETSEVTPEEQMLQAMLSDLKGGK